MANSWIKRDFEQKIRQQVKSRPAVVLTGPRQTGKTSILKHIFPNYRFVSLDLPSIAQQAEENPEIFLKDNPPPVIIDEVQYAPKLFRHLKIVIDADRSAKGQYILTGSQKFQLMKEVSESLAGRVSILDFEPLSYHEIATFRPDISYEQCMLKGGFPEVFVEDLDAFSFFQSYVASYLERDLRQVLNVGHLRDFERFLRGCALRSGQILNKSDLAKDVGISPSTSNQWLSALEAAGLVKILEPWFSNQGKRMVKSPKIYLNDSGLLCFLLNIQTEAELTKSPFIGQIWETYIFSELRKKLNLMDRARNLFFWRDRAKEIDFIYHQGGMYTLFETKYSSDPNKSHVSGLEYVKKIIGSDQVAKSYLLTRAQQEFTIAPNTTALPLSNIFHLWDSHSENN